MPIEILNLASKPVPEDPEAPQCEVFRASVRRGDGSFLKAHLKVLEKQPMAVELLCNALAKKLDLPVPECFLVRVKPPQALSFSRSARFDEVPQSEFAVFGSATLEHPTLDHFFDASETTQRLLDFIRQIADLESAAIFDEWIANDDREERSILVADTNTWWLIDHDLAFNHGIWHPGALAPKRRYDNEFAERLLAPPVPLQKLGEWDKRAKHLTNKGRICDVSSSVEEANSFDFLLPAHAQMLSDFLEERIEHLPELIRERLADATTQSAIFSAPADPSSPTQQMSLPWEPPSSP